MSDEQWKNELPGIIRSIFMKCRELGGTISGEHGIGWVQKPYLDIVFPPFHIDLFYRIKQSFDPNFILNPCKIF
jgi:glycolate oxidase